MAGKRDVIDDLIDIQNDWKAVKNPFGGIADSLAADPDSQNLYDPSNYKERPRISSLFCFDVASGDMKACTRCLDVCPVNAITITKNGVKLADNCRKCGLCSAACPTEVFVAYNVTPKSLYDKISQIASEYEQCYVTCTRALGRIPKDNEVLLPCVGAVSKETWFALLAEYKNISIYLPLGICDKCRTTTGERAFSDAIAEGEELSHGAMGLEVSEKDMTHEQTREFKRGQFMSSMVRAGASAVSATNPMVAGAAAVANKIQAHSDKMVELQNSLERAVGAKTSERDRRILTQGRKIMLTTIQTRNALAKGFADLEVPACDPTLCTACGDCVEACTLHACDLDHEGHFSVEPAYCVNCGVCAKVCPEGALTMRKCDTADLCIRDEEAERRKRAAEKQKARIEKTKAEGKKQLNRVLDGLERLADD
jgi:MinD superfamily P-loop ATPase